MTGKELALHDGRDGRRALVAVNGKIYDFTASPLWHDGNHEDRHRAGGDLTEELKSAPHIRAVIERFHVIDTLEEEIVRAPNKRIPPVVLALATVLLLLLLFLLLR